MPVRKLRRQVATTALRAAARHGFALGGGNALIAHGIIDRYTADVDLFTDEEAGVAAAAGRAEAALRDGGGGGRARGAGRFARRGPGGRAPGPECWSRGRLRRDGRRAG